MARVPLTFTVNGAEAAEFVEPGALLVDVLREKLSLTAAKLGCAQGTCGACTVTIDGALQLACLVPAERVEGRSVTTL
jgi:aerobic carbon-monoxide dehydrogenase small subunit